MPKRKKSNARSGGAGKQPFKRMTGRVYPTNLVLPDIPEVTLTPEQERRADLAIAALPASDPNYFRAFRIKIIRQLIHKQDTTESRLTTEEDQRKFDNWMAKIREELYSQNVPEHAEYLHIVLKQTQEGIPHILLLTKCPTSPKKNIPSQDIALLSYGGNLYNTNTVKFLLKLAEELPNFGNDYGGIPGLKGVINLNLNLYCPGAYKTYHGMCGICNSAVSRELEEDDDVTEPVVLPVGNVTNDDVTLADLLPPLPPPPLPLPSLPLTTTAALAAGNTTAVDNLATDDSAYDSDGSDYSPNGDEEDPLYLDLDLDDDDSFIVADSDSDSDSDDDYEPPDVDSTDDELDFDSDSESEGSDTLSVNPCEDCTDDEEEDQNNPIAEVICLLNQATIDLGGRLAVADLSGSSSKSAKKIWNKPKLKKRLKGIILIGPVGKGKGTYHPSQFCRGGVLVGKNYSESCTRKTKNAMTLSKSVKNFNNQYGGMKDETTHGRLLQKLADDRTFCFVQYPLPQSPTPSSNMTDRPFTLPSSNLFDERLFIKRRRRRRTRPSFSCYIKDCDGVTKTEGGECRRCKWWEEQKQRWDEKWNMHYTQLEDFQMMEGHCNVRITSGPLGRWVNKQRIQYKRLREGKPSSMTAERICMLNELEFEWTLIPKWEDRYTELEDFYIREGHCNVLHRSGPLGRWVKRQRAQYWLLQDGKPSTMTEERISMLTELEFEWTLKQPDWEERFAELKKFHERERHCNVRITSGPLGTWVMTQRAQYCLLQDGKPSSMTEERITKLNGLGFKWALKGKWEERFAELKKFHKRERHCNVRIASGPLGTWVANQRTQYWLLKEGKPSHMTEERISKLKGLGFKWTLKNGDAGLKQKRRKMTDWEERFAELKKFHERERHCNVNTTSGQLGEWVKTQRKQYKRLKEKKPSSMTEERITKLNGLGFKWTLKGDKWEERFAELKKFHKRERHCNVSTKSGPLGSWVKTQRKQYKRLKEKKPSLLTEERITKLNGLGFKWVLNNRKRKRSD